MKALKSVFINLLDLSSNQKQTRSQARSKSFANVNNPSNFFSRFDSFFAFLTQVILFPGLWPIHLCLLNHYLNFDDFRRFLSWFKSVVTYFSTFFQWFFISSVHFLPIFIKFLLKFRWFLTNLIIFWVNFYLFLYYFALFLINNPKGRGLVPPVPKIFE